MLFRVELAFRKLFAATLLFGLTMSLGCVSDTYRYGVDQTVGGSQPLTPSSPNPISYGGPNAKADRVEALVQAPKAFIRKLARRPEPNPADTERQREEAVSLAEEYLAVNGLNDVFIDVRTYEPRQQWERLKANKEIRPIWKYTGGTLSWLRYSILPMRAFHTDHYDPYTNTLNLNSDRPIEALFESALAKEYQNNHRLGVGTYAMMQYVPLVPLYHSAKASSDVLTFSHHHLDGEHADELYPLTYSHIGTTAVSEALSIVTLSPNAPMFTGPLLRVAGRTAGHSTGITIAKQQKLRETENSDGIVSSNVAAADSPKKQPIEQANDDGFKPKIPSMLQPLFPKSESESKPQSGQAATLNLSG